MKIAIINGPNLNLLGKREPEIYGNVSFESYLEKLRADFPDIEFLHFQSNHEGDLIDRIQEWGFEADGIVLNAAAYTHTSIAIADAVRAVPAPVVEVHLTDIEKRESYRRVSFLRDACRRTFSGFGLDSYRMAIESLLTENPDSIGQNHEN